MRKLWQSLVLIACLTGPLRAAEPAVPELTRDVLPLIKVHCVKCHGPAKQEAELSLHTAVGLAAGGQNGAVVAAKDLDSSLLWRRVEADEMPPEEPLSAADKDVLKRWIAAGAPGLPAADTAQDKSDHWAFAALAEVPTPTVRDAVRARTTVDRHLLSALEAEGLTFNIEADRRTLIRRVAFDLIGLPPTLAEVDLYLADKAPNAYERMVDRYLASPHYGERWGKYWLDAAGYADSNGYFNADSDRPLAYRYRDYVVRSFNADKPFDRFIVEQIAGDELSGYVPGRDATPEMVSLLEATHYLRNGQDGSGESDGNEDEVRIDRYSALEAASQIVGSSLLGLTLQCARCHDHKFEPVSQREYFQLQAVFYPAFNVRDWQKPNERVLVANLPGELAKWEAHSKAIDDKIAELRTGFAKWARENRPPSVVLLHDEFDPNGPGLAEHWSNVAPGDDTAAGDGPVGLDTAEAPGALRRDGSLAIVESGSGGDRWLSTKQAFDWTPDGENQWVQVTFDLVDNKLGADGQAAERIAYLIALHDFNDNSPVGKGNILIDGNPAGGASVHVDYPGDDSTSAGTFGAARYEPGHSYGVRITNVGKGKYRLEHLVDLVPEDKHLTLQAEDLPDGGFGFEYCCRRSFLVDNVVVERSAPAAEGQGGGAAVVSTLREKQSQLVAEVQALEKTRGPNPGRISSVYERSAAAPEVFLLTRGNHASPGDKVEPGPFAAIADAGNPLDIRPPFDGATSSGRRLAWAQWLTRPGSRAAALVARVQVNRIWQHHFGAGLVATPENLGTSGSPPSHPQLMDYLAGRLIGSGWSIKEMHRELMTSTAYRQASSLPSGDAGKRATEFDPQNRLLWRFNLQRLDAEALRDAVLATSGQLDESLGGPYVRTTRNESGEVVLDAAAGGATRRAIYLQQRRTQTLSFLNVFDTPTIVFNCVQRPVSTMPLQSLSLMNSEFMVTAAAKFAERISAEAPADPSERVRRAFLLATGREPAPEELQAAVGFVIEQQSLHGQTAEVAPAEAERRSWSDFCQMLLASSPFLYVE